MNKIQFKAIKYIFGLVVFISTLIFNISFASAATYSADTLVSLTNESRSQNGLGNLLANSKLSNAAYAKAQDILAKDYFAHNSPDGKTPWDFINESGYVYTYAGENLAIGYSDANELFTAWMNSPTHRENILGPNYREIGIAVVSGEFQGAETIVAVQEFGTAAEGNLAEQQVAAQLSTPTPSPSVTASPTSIPTGAKSFEFIKDKTAFTPNSIFSGEEVEFKVTISGEVKSLEAQVFDKKYNLLEAASVTGSGKEKTYTLDQKIENNGTSEVKILATDNNGNSDTLSFGTLNVKETVISKDQPEKISLIAGFKQSFKLYWFVYLAVSVLIALAIAFYFISKRSRFNGGLLTSWRF
ncbi:MAG: CAP domain-containing protein [Patescibacteria group bacterium]